MSKKTKAIFLAGIFTVLSAANSALGEEKPSQQVAHSSLLNNPCLKFGDHDSRCTVEARHQENAAGLGFLGVATGIFTLTNTLLRRKQLSR